MQLPEVMVQVWLQSKVLAENMVSGEVLSWVPLQVSVQLHHREFRLSTLDCIFLIRLRYDTIVNSLSEPVAYFPELTLA